MGLAATYSVALIGVTGHVVKVEADIANGLPGMTLVGLPDTALREARDRIRSAIVNSGENWPQRRITVGLSPASLPKRGSWFDMAIAVGVLTADRSVPAGSGDGVVFFGELGLDGRVRPVRGVLPGLVAAAKAGFGTVLVAPENAAEAALVPRMRVIAAGTLNAALDWLRGTPGMTPAVLPASEYRPDEHPAGAPSGEPGGGPDLADVIGQPTARKALEICAAGGHHLSLLGPPGVGKTLLAERLPTILPPLSVDQALEVTSIHSVAGTLAPGTPLLCRPPFLAPHHTASKAAIVGGGTSSLRPGAASLAHFGILFLDEAPEFGRDVLDALRQPLESGSVTVSRSQLTATFPAQFTLVLAANPCPCAKAGAECGCSPATRRRYMGKLSGPLLDRIDVKVRLLPVSRQELISDSGLAEPSAVVAERVAAARARAARRLKGTPWRVNAEIPGSELRRRWPPARGALASAETALDRGQISARGIVKMLRTSWTLADLAGQPRPGRAECNAALYLWLGVEG
ncbi:MAG TPA: YifB family Mg chelatase-like AAA ATPase [Streptosporangiaceae bacterium]|nr:YifB family Mg chelatase-like AAA ATPase [Streptosporangiaceae bacterium]